MRRCLIVSRRAWAAFLLWGAMLSASSAQTFTTLFDFDNSNGAFPAFTSLLQATDGNLYGMTALGGVSNNGTVFKITSDGVLTTLYEFCVISHCPDGGNPYGALVQASDGNLYATTYIGGLYGFGTVFKITLDGTLTTLHSFNSTDGANPYGGLVQGPDGNLYGTTSAGGVHGSGTVFKITTVGILTTFFNFCSQVSHTCGSSPHAQLVLATNGNFYGTTNFGGTNNSGTIFGITPKGKLTTVHSFNSTDGSHPYGGVVQATDGNLYGTTTEYGFYGTVFKLTSQGTLTTLHTFSGTDGADPETALVQATDGNLYGTTATGGTYGFGTIFRITTDGTLTTLYNFCAQGECNDGKYPLGTLVQATDGSFYGAAEEGGTNTYGTIFTLSVGLGPFIETLPSVGRAGAPVRVLGTNLTGATNVSFNGTAATFTVVSNFAIKTTVPEGATTGVVTVTTPSGTLTSNVAFQVRP